MIRAHAAAVLALLRTDPALTVYDGEVPNLPVMPYVVLWTRSPHRTSDRLCGASANADAWFQTSAVGEHPDGVRAVQEHIHSLLLDARLSVAGRSMALVRHLAAPTIQRDDTTDPPVFVGADQWGVFSTPS